MARQLLRGSAPLPRLSLLKFASLPASVASVSPLRARPLMCAETNAACGGLEIKLQYTVCCLTDWLFKFPETSPRKQRTSSILAATCTHGDVQLVGGTSQYEGRVEVCINNGWGTVCHNNWSNPDATVVCKQLGYTITGCELCTIVVLSASGHMLGYRITKLLYIALA